MKMASLQRPDATLNSAELAHYLASALGDAKALELVEVAVAKLGLVATRLERADALRVLELIAAEPGLVGIAARFVKSRLVLEWPV
jgi:hypothetical protein